MWGPAWPAGIHLANKKILETEQMLRKEGLGTFRG
jgi:hypothetical protein